MCMGLVKAWSSPPGAQASFHPSTPGFCTQDLVQKTSSLKQRARVEDSRRALLLTYSHIPSCLPGSLALPDQPLASSSKAIPTPLGPAGLPPHLPSECLSGSLLTHQPLYEMSHTKNISVILVLPDWADS